MGWCSGGGGDSFIQAGRPTGYAVMPTRVDPRHRGGGGSDGPPPGCRGEQGGAGAGRPEGGVPVNPVWFISFIQ